MNKSVSIPKLAEDIRHIYEVDPMKAETAIESYLDSNWKTYSAEERITLLENLIGEFNGRASVPAFDSVIEEEVLARLFSLVLGERISELDLSSPELLPRLADSLNTIFNKLNQIVGSINSTFKTKSEGDETIRRVIGEHLEGEDQLDSLESYLGQINRAFLVTQEAFKIAAKKIVAVILRELDPGMLSKSTVSGMKFGPLRKAEIFEIYENKHEICRKWFESSRFMADFLREFEKSASKNRFDE